MYNSLATDRRLAARLVATQLGVALLIGLLFLLQGRYAAIAALASGALVAAGTAVVALRALTPGRPGVVLMRIMAGTLFKWVLVLGGFYLIVVHWRLPALPAFAGLFAALLVSMAGLKFKR